MMTVKKKKFLGSPLTSYAANALVLENEDKDLVFF